ncbi:MAG: EF-P lysine aminoacylase EpmA [Pseudomonadota bacterium]
MTNTTDSPRMPPRAPWWRADELEKRRRYLAARHAIRRATEAYFDTRDFLAVETPALQWSPGMEPHLAAFETRLETPGNPSAPMFLHTSPEFAMKKLLAGGLERVYQLARAYRNGERSATHHPEFTMLEWYRAGQGYRDLIDDCVGLVRAAATAAGGDRCLWRGRSSDPFADWQVMSVAEAFDRFVDIDLLATAPDPASPDLGLLSDQARRVGIEPHPGDRWDDLFFRIFLDRIEPHLGHPAPTVLVDYPASMAALSRVKPADPRLCERFEIYVAGLELANAFGELTDAVEQRKRFEADQALKRSLYGRAYPIDEDFLAALDPDRGGGLPECAGIALGFDRLVMLATGADTIEKVLWAPVMAPGT